MKMQASAIEFFFFIYRLSWQQEKTITLRSLKSEAGL